jgi:putative DNA primase/helicase
MDGEISSELFAELQQSEVSLGSDIDLNEIDKEIAKKQYIDFLKTVDWSDPSRFEKACIGMDFGLDEETIFEILQPFNEKCMPVLPEQELRRRIANAGKYRQSPKGILSPQISNFNTFVQNPHEQTKIPQTNSTTTTDYSELLPNYSIELRAGKAIATAANVRHALVGPTLGFAEFWRWDEWYKRPELTVNPPWIRDTAKLEMNAQDWQELRSLFSLQIRMDVPIELLQEGVAVLSRRFSYHPIKSWLEKLKWDGEKRFHKIFNSGEEYDAKIIRIFILAAIYRVYYPGYKFDHMLVLSGGEGLGKSSLIDKLGGDYYQVLSSIPVDHRGKQEMAGAWWVELPEMSAVRRADMDQVKAFVTTRVDKYIPLFGRSGVEEHPRTQILCWSLNPKSAGYLSEDDENRRFLIINVEKPIDFYWVEQNRDQLYAEVFELFKQRIEPHKLVQEIKQEAKERAVLATGVQDIYEDDWHNPIEEWLEKNNISRLDDLRVIYQQVLGFYDFEKYTPKTKKRIQRILRVLGWRQNHSNNSKYRFYFKIGKETIDWETFCDNI